MKKLAFHFTTEMCAPAVVSERKVARGAWLFHARSWFVVAGSYLLGRGGTIGRMLGGGIGRGFTLPDVAEQVQTGNRTLFMKSRRTGE